MGEQLTRASSEKSARREKFIFLFLFYYSFSCAFLFFINSGNAERLMERKNLLALSEVGLLLLYIFGILFFRKKILTSKRNYLLCLSFPLLLSAYLHRFLLPLGLSFFYFCLLASVFGFLLSGKASYFLKKMRALICNLSCKTEVFFVLPFLFIQMNRSNIALDYDSLRYGLRSEYILFSAADSLDTGIRSLSTGAYSLSAGILPALQGFFSSHGLLNAVYSYPKGLELITAPLSFLPGYGFLLAFQLWVYLAIGLVLWLMLQKINPKGGMMPILLFFLFSSIGNMAITMKTDNITLLLQLLSLYFYSKGERKNSLSMLIFTYSFKPTAVVFSTLILIGLFLDSILNGTIKNFFYEEQSVKEKTVKEKTVKEKTEKQEVKKQEVKKQEIEKAETLCLLGSRKEGSTALLLASLLFTFIITLRTLLITGLPFSTTFTGIFQAMGFSVKWPFNLDAHVDYSGEKTGMEVFLSFVNRVFSFLFYPVGKDMEHVSIAWSGVAFPAILFLAFRNAFRGIFSRGSEAIQSKRRESNLTEGDSFLKKKKSIKEQNGSHLRIVFFLIGFFSLLSFLMLWQIDGNYYILWECLALLLAASSPLWSERQSSLLGSDRKDSESYISLRRFDLIKGIFPLLYLASILITLVTSWVGAVGFTPIDLVNKGYYDHFAVEMEKQAERGSLPLFLKMTEKTNNHVLAVSETPDCYRIPCILESITDVEGSGGSPGLYDDPLYFAWFLKWSKTDYIYVEKSFLEEETEQRAKDMLRKMAELGIMIEPEFADLTKSQDSFPEYLLVKVNQPRLEYAWKEEAYPKLTGAEKQDSEKVRAWIDSEVIMKR